MQGMPPINAGGAVLLEQQPTQQDLVRFKLFKQVEIAAQLLGPILAVEHDLARRMAIGREMSERDKYGRSDDDGEADSPMDTPSQTNLGVPVNLAWVAAGLLMHRAGVGPLPDELKPPAGRPGR